jgi:hypothetical protein
MPPRTSAVHCISGSTHERVVWARARARIASVIYCVVPEALADELYEKLADYYDDDPNVTVIVDRRKKERRLPGSTGGGQREVRDRRRPRITGDFPPLAPVE